MVRPVVVIRVAGGPRLGFGHVRRCWTLATELAAEADVRFVATTPDAADVLRAAGFDASAEVSGGDTAVLERTLAVVAGSVVAVVDDPELSGAAVEELRRRAPIVVIDDACTRALPSDLVINGSAGAAGLPYRGALDTRYLLGPDFMILRRDFAREPVRRPAAGVGRVLVLGGGGAAIAAVVDQTLQALRATVPDAEVGVIVGPFAAPPALPSVRSVTLHRNPANVRGLMLAADLAVTGGGQTAYELAASATPAVGVRLAENQRVNLRGLAAAGVLVDIGAPEEPGFPDSLVETLRRLAADPERRADMARRGRRLVDGRGAGRVAAEVLALARVGALSG
jgi:spore coat polysaccharide biosynthesis predicted glycosyltransferase SpsG